MENVAQEFKPKSVDDFLNRDDIEIYHDFEWKKMVINQKNQLLILPNEKGLRPIEVEFDILMGFQPTFRSVANLKEGIIFKITGNHIPLPVLHLFEKISEEGKTYKLIEVEN